MWDVLRWWHWPWALGHLYLQVLILVGVTGSVPSIVGAEAGAAHLAKERSTLLPPQPARESCWVGVAARPWGGPEAKPIPLHPYSMAAPQRFLPAPSLSSERRMSPCSLGQHSGMGWGAVDGAEHKGHRINPSPAGHHCAGQHRPSQDCRERRCHPPKLRNPKKSQESHFQEPLEVLAFLLFLPLCENSSRKIYESNLKSKGPRIQ